MPKPSHGSEPETHSHSWDLRWFVFEALGQEECHACNIKNVDIEVEIVEGAIDVPLDYWCVSLLLNGKFSSLTHCKRYLITPFFSDLFLDCLRKNAIDLENSFVFF